MTENNSFAHHSFANFRAPRFVDQLLLATLEFRTRSFAAISSDYRKNQVHA